MCSGVYYQSLHKSGVTLASVLLCLFLFLHTSQLNTSTFCPMLDSRIRGTSEVFSSCIWLFTMTDILIYWEIEVDPESVLSHHYKIVLSVHEPRGPCGKEGRVLIHSAVSVAQWLHCGFLSRFFFHCCDRLSYLSILSRWSRGSQTQL